MTIFPDHLVETAVVRRFRNKSGIDTPEMREALRDIGGDMFYEMRRLLATCLSLVEDAVEQGRYQGYNKGVPFTEEQKANIRKTEEDLKMAIKLAIETKWADMNNKQKTGAGKLVLALKLKKVDNVYEDQKASLLKTSNKSE